jgi:Flp pilus assembly protein TadD
MPQLTIQQAFKIALRHHQAGRLQEAENLYRQILVHQPKHAEAMHLLGVIALQVGRKDVAEDLIRQAIALKPDDAGAYINLGNALRDMGRFDEAIAAYNQALALNPNLPEAHNDLGIALAGKGELDAAIAAYRRAVALNPNLLAGHSNLGVALNMKGQLDEAIAAHRRAISLRPGYTEARNLGFALKDKGLLDEAVAAYRQAVACRLDHAEAHSDLGNALRESGQLEEAIAVYRRGIALNPSLPEAHHNLAMALLARGDFQQGWEEYEWRWKCKEYLSSAPKFAQPQWDGSRFEGRTLLLLSEQGFGDTIQFIRYLPLVAKRGGKIIIECRPELQRLFETIAVGCQVIASGQALPEFDFHCFLLSLPHILSTTFANHPQTVPYLQPDTEQTRKWQRRLTEHSAVVKVGLAWAGSPSHKNDRNRSIELARLATLREATGARFFSLQKGKMPTEAKATPAGVDLVDWSDELNDFADTASLIANLDLVISVDTAVAHLAGAMGKPVWTLLPFVPDWRWLLERQDSPWYPTMRLFRQRFPGDWDGVIARVVEQLSLLRGGR